MPNGEQYYNSAAKLNDVTTDCGSKIVFHMFRAVLLSVIVRVGLECLCCLCGFITFTYYTKRGCDPLEAGLIENSNQVSWIERCRVGGFHPITYCLSF